jgi:hypothetical protein
MAKRKIDAHGYKEEVTRYQRQSLKTISGTIAAQTALMQTSVLQAALVLGLVFSALVAKLKSDKYEGGLAAWIAANHCPQDNTRASRMQVVARACYGINPADFKQLPGSYEAIAILARYKDADDARPYDSIGGALAMIQARGDLSGLYPKTARETVKKWEGKRAEAVSSKTTQAVDRAATALKTAAEIQLPTKDSEGSVQHQGVRIAARDLLKALGPIVRDIAGIIDAAAHASKYPIGDAAGSLQIRKTDAVLAFDKAINACQEQTTEWAKLKRAAKAKTRKAKTTKATAKVAKKKVAKAS